jgi:hypothetical protein
MPFADIYRRQAMLLIRLLPVRKGTGPVTRAQGSVPTGGLSHGRSWKPPA